MIQVYIPHISYREPYTSFSNSVIRLHQAMFEGWMHFAFPCRVNLNDSTTGIHLKGKTTFFDVFMRKPINAIVHYKHAYGIWSCDKIYGEVNT